MRFYYNADMNFCAEESWVVGFLMENSEWEEESLIINKLHSCHEVYGWFECEVSNIIEELVSNYYGM